MSREVTEIQALTDAVRELTAAVRHLSSDGRGCPVPGAAVGGTTAPPQASTSRDVQASVEAYIIEREGSGEWGVSARSNYPPILRRFAERFPLLPVSHLSRAHVLAYRQWLEGQGGRASSINQKLGVVGSWAKWALLLQELSADPMVRVKLKDRAGRGRKHFTPEEVTRVWAGLKGREALRADWWIPTIMLHTGARPEEVAQLRVEEVGDYFDFAAAADTDDGRSIKTVAGRRRVPVARALWDLGLGRLVAGRRGAEPLFTAGLGVPPRRAQLVGRAFSAHVRGLGFDRRYVLHSLRHTVVTRLKQLGAEEYVIAQLVGHANGNITTGRYGGDVDMQVLAGVVDSLGFSVG